MEHKDVEAVALEMDGHKEQLYKPAYYGNQHVPHPTNHATKVVERDKIMRAVREGK